MIPEHVMRELRYIEIYTAKRIQNLRLGTYRSRWRGPGFDFDQHQPYRPGEDVRRIDWNVLARLNATYVRHTHAERELKVVIAVDVSGSMEFGHAHRSKKELMTYVTASILFSAVSDQIAAGFVAFTDRVLAYREPTRSRAAAWSTLQHCWSLLPSPGGAAMRPVAGHLLERSKDMMLVFLVSDFLVEDDVYRGCELRMLADRHDVVAVVPEDAAETTLPPGHGSMRLRDLESGREAVVGLSETNRRAFAESARRRRAETSRALHRIPIDHVFVRTDQSPVEPLLALFAARARR